MRDQLNSIYKVVKYSSKLKNKELISLLNPSNTDLIYDLLKKEYLNNQQNGGVDLLSYKNINIKNVQLMTILYHGEMNSKRNLIVPKNIHLIVPLCCGISNFETLDFYQYFQRDPENIKNDINKKERIFTIGTKNCIILKPNEQYCDIKLELRLDITVNEGIHIFENGLHKYDDVKIDISQFTQEDIIIFKSIIKNNILKENIIESSTEQKFTEYFFYYLEHTQNVELSIGNMMTNINDIEKITHNILGPKIMIKLKEIQKNIISKMLILDNNIFDEYIREKTIKLEKEKEMFLNGKIKPRMFFQSMLNLNGFLDHEIKNNNDDILIKNNYVIKKVLHNISSINIESICKNIYKNENEEEIFTGYIPIPFAFKNFLKITSELNLNNFKLSQYELLSVCHTDIYFTCVNYNIFQTDLYKSYYNSVMKVILLIQKVHKMSIIEKDLVIEKITPVLKTNKKVNLYLSDVISFIGNKIGSKHAFIYNASCQNFGNDTTCQSYKCFGMIGKLINRKEMQHIKVFNQDSIEKLINIIKYIDNHEIITDLTYINFDTTDEFYKKLIKLLHISGYNDEYNQIIAKIMIYYVSKKYPELYTNYKNMIPSTFMYQKSQLPIIMLNFFITDIYNIANADDKLYILKNMGRMESVM
jgi:hypothetical protein